MKKYFTSAIACVSILLLNLPCRQVLANDSVISRAIESDDIKISCEDISEDGSLSAYLQHGFTAENRTNLPISDPEWTLILPLDNGGFENISLPDEGFSCTTVSFDSASGYEVSKGGIMKAQLQFTCMFDGETVSARPYEVLLDFKPYIEYAVIEKIEDEAPSPSYNAYYKVSYLGADNIRVYVEEENRSEVKVTYIYEPYVAYGCATHILALYKAWIDFVAENDYGKDIYTIELLPYGEVVNNVEDIIDDFSATDSADGNIEVYDIHGMKIADIKDISEAYNLPVKGLVLIKTGSLTKKMMIR